MSHIFSNKNSFQSFLIFVLFLSFFSCSTKPTITEFDPTAIPSEEIAKLEKDLTSAKEKQIDILSPHNFTEAQNALTKAKAKFFDGQDPKKTMHEVATGKAYLALAEKSAEFAQADIANISSARQAAIDAGAMKYFNKAFSSTDKSFAAITRDIEKHKRTTTDQEKTKIQNEYLHLETSSIIENNLKKPRDIITQAKKEKADKYAPRTLAIAQKLYTDTENYIKMNPHDTAEILTRGIETLKAAERTFNINRSVKGLTKVSSEELALLVEKERENAAEKTAKLGLLEDELKTTQSALEDEKKTQNDLESNAEKLEAEKNQLEAEKIFNEKFEDAREEFTENEADVYKQGHKLIIRLKGLEFQSGDTSLQSKNYPLMSKVLEVIGKFGPTSTITIEGHTDSVGNKTLNNQLSLNRANVVKEYLEANVMSGELKIETAGFGDQKPVASNKTAKGRAQNRRVDIIISPGTEQ